jgi:hypothetical protein
MKKYIFSLICILSLVTNVEARVERTIGVTVHNAKNDGTPIAPATAGKQDLLQTTNNAIQSATEASQTALELIDNIINTDKAAVFLTDPDDITRRGKFDTVFAAPVFITGEHSEGHEGNTYTAQVIDTSMAINDTLTLAFKTPSTKRIHIIASHSQKSGGHVDLIEDAVYTTGSGSQVPAYNISRGSSNTTDLLEDTGGSFVDSNNIANVSTVAVTGTIIPNGSLYHFGTTPLAGPTESIAAAETILAPDTVYAFRYTADVGTNAGHLKLKWYEKSLE